MARWHRSAKLVAVVAAACLLTSQARAAGSKPARRQKAETVALLKKAAWLIQHPESITPRQLEQRFPGRHTARECRPEESSCAYDNGVSRRAPALSSYYLPNPRKPGAGSAHLYFTFPERGPCVRLKELDGLLGHPGRWTGVPPPQDSFGGPMRVLHDIRYEGINPRDPGVYVSAMLVDSCLSTLTIDVRPR
jgi:hypothetical protein